MKYLFYFISFIFPALCSSAQPAERDSSKMCIRDSKYPDNSQFRALMSLTYFEDAEEQFMPEMLVAIDWYRIKSFIIDKVATPVSYTHLDVYKRQT